MSHQKLASKFPTGKRQRADRYRGLCVCGEHAWAVLTKGFVTFVSPEDAHHLQGRKWRAAVYAYNLIYAESSNVGLHRKILGKAATEYIDHKDHDGTNNRRTNLRPCSHGQNLSNGRYRPGYSGFRGVRVDHSGRWRARIAHCHLGTFATPEEAARAYDAAATKYFGEFATLNFPPGPRGDD
jgi:hypothetical protein